MSDKTQVCVNALLGVGILLLAFCAGGALGEYLCRKEAIKASVAEWRINPTTGEKSFAWKECGK